MSTTAPSEFIIGHSVDDAAERRAELRKIGWALLAALVLHLVIGTLIAAFHDKLFTRAEPVEEDKPMEMTIVDLPPTPAATPQKNSMFMETDESKAAKQAPQEKTFESNANSVAASQQPATGGMPLPSQQGVERPNVDLESHSYSLPNEGAQPQPSVAPKSTPQESAAPQETPRADVLAMLTKPTATPQPSAAQTPAPVASKYRPLKQQTRITGNISTRGISAVNAIGTPLGRYQKRLFDSIGSRWYGSIQSKMDLFNVGTTRIFFRVDRTGRINSVKVLENSSNELFVNYCLQAIQEAHAEPMPDDLAATLPPDGLEVEVPFTLYSN